MRFINGFGNQLLGFPRINMDKVVTIQQVNPKIPDKGWRCLDASGEILGIISDDSVDQLNKDRRVLIPNTSKCTLIIFFTDVPGIELQWEEYPILAWSIDDDLVEPVTFESLPDKWCIKLPGGKFSFPEEAYCETIEEAMDYIKPYVVKKAT